MAWARKERKELDIAVEAERFRDYWHAKAGKDGRKLDWQATWRNWVRGTNAPRRGATSGTDRYEPLPGEI